MKLTRLILLLLLLALPASAQKVFQLPNQPTLSSNSLFLTTADAIGGGSRNTSYGQLTGQLGTVFAPKNGPFIGDGNGLTNLPGGSGTAGAVTNNDTRNLNLSYLDVNYIWDTNRLVLSGTSGNTAADGTWYWNSGSKSYTNAVLWSGRAWHSNFSVFSGAALLLTNAAHPDAYALAVLDFSSLPTSVLDTNLNATAGNATFLQLSTNNVYGSAIVGTHITADYYDGNGSNITGLTFVRTNETRPIIDTDYIASSNTVSGSNFVSRVFASPTTPLLQLNYYPGSTNYLQFLNGQLAFAPSDATSGDRGLVWGGSYLRLGYDATTPTYGWLQRVYGSIGIEMTEDGAKMRLGDDHRTEQLVEISAGAIPGSVDEELNVRRSHILALRAHGTNRFYCWVGFQARNPDETVAFPLLGSGNQGSADLYAYYSLPFRDYNTNGGWKDVTATNTIFRGGKTGFDVWTGKNAARFAVTNEIAGTNVAIISPLGSKINNVGITNGNVTIPGNLDVAGTSSYGTVNATNFSVTNPWDAGNATNINSSNIVFYPKTVATLPSPAANTYPRYFCTDVVTSSGTGDLVTWNGTTWKTTEGVTATADIKTFIISAIGAGLNVSNAKSRILLAQNNSLLNGVSTLFGALGRQVGSSGAGQTTTAGFSNYGMVMNLNTGTTIGFGGTWYWGTYETSTGPASGDFLGCGGVYSVSALATSAEQYYLWVGFDSQANTGVYPTAGAGFLYDGFNTNAVVSNATFTATWTNNWICVAGNTSMTTNVADSGLPVDVTTSPSNRLFVVVTSTNIMFFTNGVQCAQLTNTAQIPSANLYSSKIIVRKTLGTTSRSFYEAMPMLHVRKGTTRTLP